jgi:hypothetical protein
LPPVPLLLLLLLVTLLLTLIHFVVLLFKLHRKFSWRALKDGCVVPLPCERTPFFSQVSRRGNGLAPDL